MVSPLAGSALRATGCTYSQPQTGQRTSGRSGVLMLLPSSHTTSLTLPPQAQVLSLPPRGSALLLPASGRSPPLAHRGSKLPASRRTLPASSIRTTRSCRTPAHAQGLGSSGTHVRSEGFEVSILISRHRCLVSVSLVRLQDARSL